MLVHCWVSGALSPFLVPDHFAGVHGLCVLVVVGVLCENCIVDASIKHMGRAAFVWCVVCVCVISFLCLFCQVHLCGHPRLFVCGGLCVRY